MATKKKKVGRPTLPRDQFRGKITTLRLQPDERATFEKAAKRKGLSLSNWIRETLKLAIGYDKV